MDNNNTQPPCPFVTASQLSAFSGKSVVVAGTVASCTDRTMVLDSGDGSKINVNRSQALFTPIDVGSAILVRGRVNQDASIVECKEFPATPLGEKFDMTLYNDVAALTANMLFVHMFN